MPTYDKGIMNSNDAESITQTIYCYVDYFLSMYNALWVDKTMIQVLLPV